MYRWCSVLIRVGRRALDRANQIYRVGTRHLSPRKLRRSKCARRLSRSRIESLLVNEKTPDAVRYDHSRKKELVSEEDDDAYADRVDRRRIELMRNNVSRSTFGAAAVRLVLMECNL